MQAASATSTATIATTASRTIQGYRPQRFRLRRSSLVAGAYAVLYGSLIFSTSRAYDPLAYVLLLGPLLVCFLYGHCIRTEERRHSADERQILAARADELMKQARQRAAERHALLEEFQRQRQALDKAKRAKDQFLGVLSHELRTPLNVILGYARLLKERMLGDLEPIQVQALDKIVGHARCQLAMVSDILQVTSLESGESIVRPRALGLTGLLDDLKAGHEVPDGKNLRLVWEYPHNLPAVKTDGEKLKHILRNLIDNAIKFTHSGAVKVSARIVAAPDGAAAGKKVIEFRVSDTGVGIAPDHLPRVFDIFHQIDSSTTRAYGGVGMGLHVVKRLTALLGGTVRVQSMLGQGSIFTVGFTFEESSEEARPTAAVHA